MFEFFGETTSRTLTKRLNESAKAETLWSRGGGLMAKSTTPDARAGGVKVASTPLAKALSKAVDSLWIGRSKEELCEAADTNTKTLHRVITGENATMTPKVRAICDVLGIDPDAAEKGEVKVLPVEQRVIHRQLESLLKSPHGRTMRAQINALYRSLPSNDDG